MKRSILLILMGAALATSAFADPEGNSGKNGGCADLPSYSQLKTALTTAVAAETSGLDFQMWATIVDRDGIVCAVAFSGADRGAERG